VSADILAGVAATAAALFSGPTLQLPDDLRLRTRELHDRKNQQRSRLRLLAPTPVIRAMTGVHEADDQVVDLAFQYPCVHIRSGRRQLTAAKRRGERS
jgi:hypothetical protein